MSFDKLIKADKLRLLYNQSLLGLFAGILTAGLVARILWSNQPTFGVVLWFAAVLITGLIRLFLFERYFRIRPQGEDILRWEKPYVVTLALSGIAWGMLPFLVELQSAPFSQGVVLAFLMGVSASSVTVYAADYRCTLMSIGLVMGPYTLMLLFWGEEAQILMGIGSVVFLASTVRASSLMTGALANTLQRTHSLSAEKEMAEGHARTDSLTGLMNRRAFEASAGKFLDTSIYYTRSVTMIVVDVDHFKQVNDRYGHGVGDEALKHVAKVLGGGVRNTDLCARFGGEEFVILLPNTKLDAGNVVAEKLRRELESTPLVVGGGTVLHLTASFGVAEGEGGESIDDLYNRADLAMYRAKREGRNRVCYV